MTRSWLADWRRHWSRVLVGVALSLPAGASEGGFGLDFLPESVKFSPRYHTTERPRRPQFHFEAFTDTETKSTETTHSESTSSKTTTLPFECGVGASKWQQWSTEQKAYCCPRLRHGCRVEQTTTTTPKWKSTSEEHLHLALLVRGFDLVMLGKPQKIFLEAGLARRIAEAAGVAPEDVGDLRGMRESVSMDEGSYSMRENWWTRSEYCDDASDGDSFTLVSGDIKMTRGEAYDIEQHLDSTAFEQGIAELIDRNLHDDSLAKTGLVRVCGSHRSFDPPLNDATETTRTTITGTSLTTTRTNTGTTTSTRTLTTSTTSTVTTSTSTVTTMLNPMLGVASYHPISTSEKVAVWFIGLGLLITLVAMIVICATTGSCCQRSARTVPQSVDEEAALQALRSPTSPHVELPPAAAGVLAAPEAGAHEAAAAQAVPSYPG